MSTPKTVDACYHRIERPDALLRDAALIANRQMLRDNQALPVEDESCAELYLNSLQLEIDHVAPEAYRLSALLAELVEQHRFILSSKAPIRKLPAEVLSEVFIALASDHAPEKRAPAIIRTVAGVCASWRTIAWGTPTLWTCIAVDCEKSQPWDALLDDQIRARSLARLAPYASRWWNIELVGACDAFAQMSLVFPHLFRATIRLPSYDPHALEILGGAPALRSLFVEATYIWDLFGHPALGFPPLPPLDALTDLRIDAISLSVEVLLDALAQCATSLECLFLLAGEGSTAFGSARQRIILPNLHTADLLYNAHQILPYIDAPALQNLVFRGTHMMDTGDPCMSLLQLLEHGPISLLSLELDEIRSTIEPSAMLQCFTRLNGLSELTVRESRNAFAVVLSHTVLDSMVGAPDVAPLFPHLEFLTMQFSHYSVDEATRNVVDRLVASRTTSRMCGGLAIEALSHCDIQGIPGRPSVQSTRLRWEVDSSTAGWGPDGGWGSDQSNPWG
ncbi:hypothetical protein BD626DRAFT_476908 [Schizophyllum amplum]|uniref:Uncharacterized protein n=1 Tax=Schizophyllum amplum TaxID=97359 RepID=A0A550CZR2_9AGAR|nr:hypothetical protein BD626DRAFT_476908 [Auriculariopsis ampla]